MYSFVSFRFNVRIILVFVYIMCVCGLHYSTLLHGHVYCVERYKLNNILFQAKTHRIMQIKNKGGEGEDQVKMRQMEGKR